MYGHPERPLARKGGARVLGERVEHAVRQALGGKVLTLAGMVGRSRGQRVLLHGACLRDLALGAADLGRHLQLAVAGDALGYARELARRTRGRWVPRWAGEAAAEVRVGGVVLEIGVLTGGVLPFLANREFTIEGLGFDVSEPTGLLDAWGGLDDAAGRRLAPTGARPLTAGTLLRGLVLELEHRLEAAPRLKGAAGRLFAPEELRGLPPETFHTLFTPALVPGRAGWFRDGRLERVLSSWIRPCGSAPRVPDHRLLEAFDRLEGGLAARQVQERGVRPGAGLPAAARLLGLYASRRPGPDHLGGRWIDWAASTGPFGYDALGEGLATSGAVTRTLAGLAAAARDLQERGFPRRIPRCEGRADVVRASAALVLAALEEAAPARGDVAVLGPDPLTALVRLVGIRLPARAA